MPRTHGYSKKGNRCFGTHNWGEKGRINVIGALLGSFLLTANLFTTNINSVIFEAWIKEDLLTKLSCQSVLVMDNASFHKRESLRLSIEKSGHSLLYLPAYSPDLNPIERKWAQAKSIRRKTQIDIEGLFCLKNL